MIARAVAVLVTAAFVVSPVAAQAVSVQVRTYDTTLVATGGAGTAATNLPIPPGLVPVLLEADVVPQGTATGTVRVSVGRIFATVDAQAGGRVRLELPPDLVLADPTVLPISIENNYDFLDDRTCIIDESTTQTLTNLKLTLEGTTALPRTVAQFFDSSVTEIDIVPSDLSKAATSGAMQLASTLGYLYPSSTSITVTRAPTVFGPGARIVHVKSGASSKSEIDLEAGTPTLTLSGTAPQLSSAAIALSSPANLLADAPKVTELSSEVNAQGQVSQTFAQAGARFVSLLANRGTVSAAVGVDQVRFGPPVGEYSVHVEGFYTPAPAATQARLSLLWNDQLLASTLLGPEDSFVLDGVVSTPTRTGQVRVVLESAPSSGPCEAPGLGMRADVDTSKSTITATRGQALAPGFDRFPQVMFPVIPVAFGSSPSSFSRLDAAAQLLVALARANPLPLTINQVSFNQAKNSASTALVVGATATDAQALNAPLRMAPWRAVDAAGQEYTVKVDGPFAALQAYQQNGRDLLVLASTSMGEPLLKSLATSINELEFGWSSLDSDLYIALPDSEPFTLTSQVLVPQEEVTSEFRKIPIWFWAVLFLTLVAIAGRIVYVRTRRGRMAARLAAQMDVHNPVKPSEDSVK